MGLELVLNHASTMRRPRSRFGRPGSSAPDPRARARDAVAGRPVSPRGRSCVDGRSSPTKFCSPPAILADDAARGGAKSVRTRGAEDEASSMPEIH